ncbi:MAG: phosphonoacetaldehyde reductase [Elusimicrobiota bacterium]|jgi:alcohol dehydrogenase class IV|nr:phosphonoacetaldehyde reductase [Elusimicrobiota bacterium]
MLIVDNASLSCGSIKELPFVLRKIGNVKKILIFTGKKVFENFRGIIIPLLESYDIDYYSDFSTNPTDTDLQKALNKLKKDYQAIIAIGGGSVIDFAKLFNFNRGKHLFLTAVPTTAGSGSEATKFAVYWVKGKKQSVEDESILPNYAIVDSQFLTSCPKYLKACSSFDAFAQAVESFWSIRSTDESRRYAKKSIYLCKENIVDFVNSNDKKSMENMSLASFLAGKAINISKTTAAHALSYVFTIRFNIPHGHAVALSFSKLFAANTNIPIGALNDKRGLDYVNEISKELKDILSKEYFDKLFEKINLETRLKKLGINNTAELVKEVNLERMANNPRIFTQKELEDLFNND